jgi:hypothetical protein
MTLSSALYLLQLEGSVGNRADRAWQLAPSLSSLTAMMVDCAEQAKKAGDHAASRAYVTEASEAGKKTLELLKAAPLPPPRWFTKVRRTPMPVPLQPVRPVWLSRGSPTDWGTLLFPHTSTQEALVSLVSPMLLMSSKLVKLHAPEIGTLFARIALDLGPDWMAAECGINLSQALVASRRLGEALKVALQVCTMDRLLPARASVIGVVPREAWLMTGSSTGQRGRRTRIDTPSQRVGPRCTRVPGAGRPHAGCRLGEGGVGPGPEAMEAATGQDAVRPGPGSRRAGRRRRSW